MATLNNLAEVNSGMDTTSYATGAFTPPASSRIFCAVLRNANAAVPLEPVLTQTDETWSAAIATLYFDTTDAGFRASVFLFRCDTSSSPGSNALNISMAGQTSDMCHAVVFSLDNLNKGSSPGDELAQAIVGNSGSGSGPASATLGSAPAGTNVAVGICGLHIVEDMTPGSGYTQLWDGGEGSSSGRSHALMIEYDATPPSDGIADYTFSSSGEWGVMVVEFVISVAGGGQPPRSMDQFRRRRAA